MSHTCSDCGKEFDTEHGLNTHRGHVHLNSFEDRFWDKVDRGDPDECWEWTAGTNGEGEGGTTCMNGDSMSSQRASYIIHHGEPDGNVYNVCENTLCVNPNHLVAGLKERFYKNVDKDGPMIERLGSKCWEWTGFTERYGRLKVDGDQIGAHRISYQINHGEIPEDMYVLHDCDNPSCVNPHHLHLGTAKDNIQEAHDRGRADHSGENHPQTDFTDRDVWAIKWLLKHTGFTHQQIADKYDVCRSTISQIYRGEIWDHITLD